MNLRVEMSRSRQFHIILNLTALIPQGNLNLVIANPTPLLNWGYHGREAAMFYQLFFLLQIEEGFEM
jgi:hypothetical protein